jgi:hypothetical protein
VKIGKRSNMIGIVEIAKINIERRVQVFQNGFFGPETMVLIAFYIYEKNEP